MTLSSDTQNRNLSLWRIESVPGHLLCFMLTMSLLACAFPPIAFWPAAYFAIVPLGVVAVRSRHRWRLLWTGYIASVFFWLLMIHWLSMVTVPGYIVLCLILPFYFAIVAPLVRLISTALRLPMAVALPLVWVSLEFLRSISPAGGFSWFFLGHSQAPYLPGQGAGRMIQIADLFGELGVSFVVAMASGLLTDMLVFGLYGPAAKGRRRRMRPGARVALGLTSTVLTFAFLYGQHRLSEYSQVTEAGLVVAVVQTNVPQDNKNRPNLKTDQNMWDQLEQLTREASTLQPRPTVIVWPETTVPGPMDLWDATDLRRRQLFWEKARPQELLASEHAALYEQIAADLGIELEQYPAYMAQWLDFKASRRRAVLELAQDVQADLVVGCSTSVPQGSGKPDARYNSAYLCPAEDGFPSQRYDKVHRVPFGEYLPWVESVPALRDWFIRYFTPYDHDYSLSAGRDLAVFPIEFEGQTVRCVTPICFEDAVSSLCQRMAYDASGSKRADLFINITNDGWYPGTPQGFQHFQIAVLRCVENRVPMVRSVNTGVSGAITSNGQVVQMVSKDGRFQQVVGVSGWQIELDRRRSVYGVVGQWPIRFLAVATLILSLLALHLRRRRGKISDTGPMATEQTSSRTESDS